MPYRGTLLDYARAHGVIVKRVEWNDGNHIFVMSNDVRLESEFMMSVKSPTRQGGVRAGSGRPKARAAGA